MSRTNVVITGLGPICGFGVGVEPFWSSMNEGRSAMKRIRRFDPAGFPCRHAAELDDDAFKVRDVVPKSYRKATKVMARDIELAVGAAAAAVDDAGLVTKARDGGDTPTIEPDRFGCHIGAGLIAADVNELTAALVTSRAEDGSFDLDDWGANGINNLTPLWLLKYLPNMLSCHVTIIHDCRGPSNTITCGEASVGLSVGESMRVIERGSADVCLSGGAEHKINPMGLLRQIYAGRLAETHDEEDSTQIVKPFDTNARGSLLGEGGGIVVLESALSAHARRARVYAALVGFAATQSVWNDAACVWPDESDESLATAIRTALRSTEIDAADIDAIAPLGCAIPAVDRLESQAIHDVFGDRAGDIPLITTLPNVGNCCAGAGAFPLIAGALALHHQMLPARLNSTNVNGLHAEAAPSCKASLEHVLVITPGLGGQNVALILRRVAA